MEHSMLTRLPPASESLALQQFSVLVSRVPVLVGQGEACLARPIESVAPRKRLRYLTLLVSPRPLAWSA